MNEQPTIRPARADDLPAIVAMRDELNVLELAACPHASIQKLSLEEFTRLWGATLSSPEYCWRVIEIAGQPVGFGLIYILKPRTQPPGVYVQWAFVKPDCRQQGLGQALLQQLADWARSQGANRIELQFIDGNTIAEKFWTKMGFRPYAQRCVQYLDV